MSIFEVLLVVYIVGDVLESIRIPKHEIYHRYMTTKGLNTDVVTEGTWGPHNRLTDEL